MNNLITLEDICCKTEQILVSQSVAEIGIRNIKIIIKISPSNTETSFEVFCMGKFYENLNIDEAIAKYNSFNNIFNRQ